MKGISKNRDYSRELVVGANQYRQVLNPPWMLAEKQPRWFRYNYKVGAQAPTRVATRE